MPLIFNVQRCSVHDGPGIRTTVFFKGCPLRCRWCHNPESWSFEQERLFRPERCIGCGRCALGCASGARQTVGREYPPQDLARLLARDQQVYETSGGGVTLSGGEVLAQPTDYVLALLRALARRGIHCAIDTCGFAPWAKIEPLLPYAQLWLYDLKVATPELHMQHTGVDNALILENLAGLAATGANVQLRVPVIPTVNAEDEEMQRIIDRAKRHVPGRRVSLLPYHKFGQDKMPGQGTFEPPAHESMEHIQRMWREADFTDVSIGG